jgi:hypothetical protein
MTRDVLLRYRSGLSRLPWIARIVAFLDRIISA